MDEVRELRVLLFEAVRIMADHAADCADPHDDLDRPCPCGRNDFITRAMAKLMPYCTVCGDAAITGYDYCAQHFKTTMEELIDCFPKKPDA